MGDEQHCRSLFAVDAPELAQDFSLDGDVQRRRRLIGDDQLGRGDNGGGDHGPLAHAAGELVRVLAEPVGRLGDVDAGQRLGDDLSCLGAAHAQVGAQDLGELGTHPQGRVERGAGILVDDADFLGQA